MAIDFSRGIVQDPKIDIIGKEVPLQALQSTGNTLQERFDKSYENETKTQALMKKALQDVSEEDKPAAQEAFNLYQNRLADRAKSGDYHNMRWQTLQDAQEFSNIYSGLANKAQQIAKEKERIATTKDYLTDESRAAALTQFQNKLNKASFDPQNRVLQGLTVNPFKEAADVNVAEKLLQIAPTLRPKTFKGKGTSFGKRTVDGKTYMTLETEGGNWRVLKPEEIANELKAYGKNDLEIQAMVNRDIERSGITNPQEKQKAFNSIYDKYVNGAANALGQMYEIREDGRQNTFNVLGEYSPSSNGEGYGIDADPTNLQVTQGQVDINKNIDDKIKALDDISFDNEGKAGLGFKGAVKAAGQAIGNPLNPFSGDTEALSRLSNIKSVVPEVLYNKLKTVKDPSGKPLSDYRIKEAYKEHLMRKKKVVNSKYTAIDSKEQTQLKNAIQAGASGTEYRDLEGNVVDVSDNNKFNWENADVAFYPGKGIYTLTSGNQTIVPTTIDPAIQNYMNQSKELIDDFTNIASQHNIVSVPTVTGKNIQVHIFKDKIREDGTYNGYIQQTQPIYGEDGQITGYSKVGQPVKYDTKKDGYTPEVINSKIRHLVKLSAASKI